MDIQKTTDYKQFKMIKGNREISHGNYVNLSKSILANNMLAANPIIVNEKMEVIDGQHRLKVAEDNKLPVYYIVATGATIDAIRLLNTNNERWTGYHFVKSYADLGNENYKTLLSFSQRYKFPISLTMSLIGEEKYPKTETVDGKKTYHSEGRVSLYTALKNGTFEVTRLEEGERVAEAVELLRKYVPGNVKHHPVFVRAVRRVMDMDAQFPEKLATKMEQYGLTIERVSDVKGYLRQFEDIHNYRLTEQNYIRLY